MGMQSTPSAQTWRQVDPNHIVDEYFPQKTSLLKFCQRCVSTNQIRLLARPFLMRKALLGKIAGWHAHGSAYTSLDTIPHFLDFIKIHEKVCK